jgi:hypothetical protein
MNRLRNFRCFSTKVRIVKLAVRWSKREAPNLLSYATAFLHPLRASVRQNRQTTRLWEPEGWDTLHRVPGAVSEALGAGSLTDRRPQARARVPFGRPDSEEGREPNKTARAHASGPGTLTCFRALRQET